MNLYFPNEFIGETSLMLDMLALEFLLLMQQGPPLRCWRALRAGTPSFHTNSLWIPKVPEDSYANVLIMSVSFWICVANFVLVLFGLSLVSL